MMSQIKNLKFSVILLLLGMSLFVASCTCDEDCAEFSDFKMCEAAPSSAGCSSNTNVFAQDADFISLSVQIKYGEPNDILSAKYFIKENNSFTEFSSQMIALKDIDENVNGDERKIRASTGIARNPGRMWPKGEYKVEIELTQEVIPLNATQNFTVE